MVYHSQRGFTVLELVIVILAVLILGLLISFLFL